MLTPTTDTNKISKVFAAIEQYRKEIAEQQERYEADKKALDDKHKQEAKALDDKYQEQIKESFDRFNKAKGEFGSLMKETGLADLFGPAFTPAKKGKAGKAAKAPAALGTRKSRTSSDEVKATLERNKTIYTSEYELGIDERTGLPKRYKGRSQKNVDIDRMMKQDEAAYQGSQATHKNAEGRNNLNETVGGVIEQLEKAYGSPIKKKPAAKK